MTPTFECLGLVVDGAVAHLELRRPEKLNALSRRLLGDLAEAAHWLDGQRQVKVVTVLAQGRAFSAGFDLGDFADADPQLSVRDTADLGRVMADAVADLRALTVVGIQGRCVGGGVVLAAACDLRLAADDAVFSIPEVDLGIPLAWGGIPRLVREIGPARTKELVLTCREFGPAEAAAMGFLNRVVPAADLRAAVDDLARSLATKSTLTITATKAHVNAVAEEVASTASARRDADVLAAALRDPESRAAAEAYLAARAARRAERG